MNRYRLALAIAGLLLFVAGFVSGGLFTARLQATGSEAGAPSPMSGNVASAASMPTLDVTGADIDGLPRYPGAVRVEYRHVVVDNLEETEVECIYLVLQVVACSQHQDRQRGARSAHAFQDLMAVQAREGNVQYHQFDRFVCCQKNAVLAGFSQQDLVSVGV